jgi:WD40 repeat protein
MRSNSDQGAVNLQHDGFVHCIAVDDTGRYLASSSADRTINIFVRRNTVESVGDGADSWVFGCSVKEHAGAVTRVAWANPQYGCILGSIGQDMLIMLTSVSTNMSNGKLVTKAAKFASFKAGIQNSDLLMDMAFLPPRAYHTMLFAVASLDGTVWFYGIDQTQVARKFKLSEPEHLKTGVSAIAFSPCLADKDFVMAVGTAAGQFELYEYSSINNKFLRGELTSSSGPLLMASSSVPVSCIAWAPPVGRPFHLIAVCSRRGTTIFRVSKVSAAPETKEKGSVFECELFSCSRPSVTASWNASGTMLSFSDDEEGRKVEWLQLMDPTDHQSWVVV